MLYRRFGRTELQMPVLSCGGMRYQFFRRDLPKWLLPSFHQSHINAIVDKALACGINHFETARDYGTSEIQLGRALQRHPRNSYILQTKVFPQSDTGSFRHTLERSLANLDHDFVDLFAIHGLNTQQLIDYALRDGGCLDVAREYQAAGRIGSIGFSTHARTTEIQQVVATDQFDFLNVHWYYINQGNWPAIEAAADHDMGVFIISPSDKGGMLYRPPAKLARLCEPLSPMLFNDLFCLERPQVNTLSIGAARPGDFDEHLKVVALLENPDRHLAEITTRLTAAAEKALGRSWMQSWEQGLPEPENTPGEISIRTILWLRNLLMAYDMDEYARMRYNLLGNGGHWFPGQRADKLDDLDLDDCLAASPNAGEIKSLLADAHNRLVGKRQRRLSRSLWVRN